MWLVGLGVTCIIIAVPLLLFAPPGIAARDNPRASVPRHPAHTDHTSLMTGPFASGQEVTRTCLTCHEDAAHKVMQTAHWTWLGDPVQIEGQDELIAIGKANLLNNFCIGVQSNWPGCTRCHAGYGWTNASFDFSNQENVDCLVCHDQSGGYVKATAGLPAEDVDLVAAAQSVGIPTRENCGSCHFNGGGGNGVKHGDLDESLYYPTEDIDVHMGRLDFQCVDCHRTENHQISGRSMSVSVDSINQVYCTDCHSQTPHEDDRINAHVDTVACQTCHIPQGALRDPTKMEWDWSTAGQDWPESIHTYLRIKGSFIYESNFIPEYAWYNGTNDRYLLGDPTDPEQVTVMNMPYGDIDDPNALIWPFKIHRGSQIYDAIYDYFLQPQTAGEGGYWTTFDWDSALRNGSAVTGLPYSGSYGFAPTAMYWPLSHMVVPADQALQCTACHGENSRMNWEALGYYGDPMIWGGRGE